MAASLHTTQPMSPLTLTPGYGGASISGHRSGEKNSPDAASETTRPSTPSSTSPAADPSSPSPGGAPQGNFIDTLSLSREAEAIRQLQQRDREVRTHEAAHAAVGGRYAGHPTYQFQRGPDGQQYAIGGEVAIDVSKVPGDPEATLQKAEQIRAAALAPAQPSAADMKIAQRAQMMATEARMELAQQQAEALVSASDDTPQADDSSDSESATATSADAGQTEGSRRTAFAVYA